MATMSAKKKAECGPKAEVLKLGYPWPIQYWIIINQNPRTEDSRFGGAVSFRSVPDFSLAFVQSIQDTR